MTIENDPAMLKSNYVRTAKDRYWTEPWCTEALLDFIPLPSRVWEPAAGRGDITDVLQEHGVYVISSDIDMSEYYRFGLPEYHQGVNFQSDFFSETGVDAHVIISNPPYDKAVEFIRHALNEIKVEKLYLLLRSEFKSASGRADIFGDSYYYQGEIVLTKRPRWDWWFRDKSKYHPRHNYSWFCWNRSVSSTNPWQKFYYHNNKREK